MSRVLVISTSLRAKGSLFCGGIGDPDEAGGKNEELNEAYEFGKELA
ncbi:MAG: hypothetical protein J6N21_09395 [Butyrivibrio sp.]|nr:hypothetical protein [Butyrivibrio sp.]